MIRTLSSKIEVQGGVASSGELVLATGISFLCWLVLMRVLEWAQTLVGYQNRHDFLKIPQLLFLQIQEYFLFFVDYISLLSASG